MASDETESTFVVGMCNAPGNIPQDVKEAVARWYSKSSETQGFAAEISNRLQATEMNIYDREDEPGKKEVRLVFEIDVLHDMCNFIGAMHGGCTAFLIDMCSSVALSLLASQVAPEKASHVSLVINTAYHAPAPLNCRLKIVNTTVALGSRVYTARTEIFDKTHGRLVASGVHMKMTPSTKL